MPTASRFPAVLPWIVTGIACLAGTIPAHAQAFQCANVTGVPPYVRAEGMAEILGDIVLDCTGGMPTPPNQMIPQVNIAVNLDTFMTSKVTAVSNDHVQYLESLLLMDEPSSVFNPTIPILNCGNSGAPDNTASGPGVCAIQGGGSLGASATYNGTPGHPNVFQGRSLALITGIEYQLVFASVPIDPPGTICPNQATQPVCHRIVRITNIRGDATTLGVSANNLGAINAQLVINPVVGLPVDQPQHVVARVQRGLMITPSASSIRVREWFLDAFKPKNISLTVANGTLCPIPIYLGGTAYPSDAAQNVTAFVYETESGFQWQNNSINGPPSPNPPCIGGITNVGNPFASLGLGGLNTGIAAAGVANAGTRVAIRFANVPAGASVQVPQVVQLRNALTNTITGVMVLTNTDSAGAGGFSPASAVLASNLAVYEVLFAGANALEFADVPFTLLNAPANTSVQVDATFAPLYGTAEAHHASSALPVPRFGTQSIPVSIDIKPGVFPNVINLKSGGTVQVAILSSASFDATTVDPLTIKLAGAGVKTTGKGSAMVSLQDVDGDGRADMVVRILVDDLQLTSSDTQATLIGATLAGHQIFGSDSVAPFH